MQNAMRPIGLAIGVLALALGVGAQAQAGLNLVLNPGFETDSFTDWSLSGNVSFASITTTAHSGSFAARFGAIGSPTDLSQTQTLPTVAGDQYTISFWLKNEGGSPNLFSAKFGNDTLVTLTNQSPFPYTEFTYSSTAASSSTPLEFQFQQNPSFWDFDDVSVTDLSAGPVPVPEPRTLFSAGIGGLLGLGLVWHRRRPKADA